MLPITWSSVLSSVLWLTLTAAVTPAALASGGDSWTTVAAIPTPRAGLSAVTGADGRIYAIGGANLVLLRQQGTTSHVPLPLVEVYAPSSNTWSTGPTLQAQRTLFGAVAARDGRIYVAGGYGGPAGQSILNSLEAYKPGADGWISLAPMPTPLSGLALVQAGDGKLYAIGGCSQLVDGRCLTSTTVEAYDPASNTWNSAPGLPYPHLGAAAAPTADGRIVVFGGSDDSENGIDRVDVYDPASGTWSQRASMPTARMNPAAALGPDGLIYVSGGYGNNTIYGTVEAYDPVHDSWTTRSPMKIIREAHGAAVAPDGRMYVVSGMSGPDQYVPDTEAYTPGAPGQPVTLSPAAGASCQFILGFKQLASQVPDAVGPCLTNQATALNGDAQQRTANGLLVWRKSDNWTAFTNGARTWMNGPYGLVNRANTERFPWEAEYGKPGLNPAPPEPAAAAFQDQDKADAVQAERSYLQELQNKDIDAYSQAFIDLVPPDTPSWALLKSVATDDNLQVTDEGAQALDWKEGRATVQMTLTEKPGVPNPPDPLRPQHIVRKDVLIKTPNGWKYVQSTLTQVQFLD